jgi:chromosome segregation ATPase
MAVSTLEEVGTLMDSIDKARNALKLELEEGTQYNDYVDRMQDINNYVSETEQKLNNLEKELENSSSINKRYAGTIARLKKDLTAKGAEIAVLQENVEKYKSENNNLLNIVDLQTAEISDMEIDIEQKKEELTLLENRIQEIMIKSQMTEAEAYFARGEAVEEAARRTKLAPKKKKETYKEALELYKKAKAFGHEGCEDKITEIEKKI